MKSIIRARGDSHKKRKVTAAEVKIENSRTRKQTQARKKQKSVSCPIIIGKNDAVNELDGNFMNNTNDANNNDAITNNATMNDTIMNTINNNAITNNNIMNNTIADDAAIINDTADVNHAIETVDLDEPIVVDCNLPKHKAKSFLLISKDRINIAFRLGLDNYSNIVPQISKEIISNFSHTYKRRCTNLCRTGCIISSSKVDNRNPNNTAPISSPWSGIDGISISNYFRCYMEDYMTRNVRELLLVFLPSRYGDDTFSN